MGIAASEESLLNRDISTLVYPHVEGSGTLDSWPQVRKGRSNESALPGSYPVIWQTYISLPGNRCKVINQAQWGLCCLRHNVVFGDIEEGTRTPGLPDVESLLAVAPWPLETLINLLLSQLQAEL